MSQDPLLRTSRITLLQEAYRGDFGDGFDPQMFRQDNFYAAQVLERSLRDGSAQLQTIARPMEQQLLSSLDIEVVDLEGMDEPVTATGETNADAHLPVLPIPEAARLRAGAQPALETEVDPAAGAERRGANPRAGHVRLTDREVLQLSQMRIQYRKTFGMFFDIMEFTGNDLYARTLLKLCVNSGNPYLALLAEEFIGENQAPRLHRRKGVADLELTMQ
jgi:hypothetical protein